MNIINCFCGKINIIWLDIKNLEKENSLFKSLNCTEWVLNQFVRRCEMMYKSHNYLVTAKCKMNQLPLKKHSF